MFMKTNTTLAALLVLSSLTAVAAAQPGNDCIAPCTLAPSAPAPAPLPAPQQAPAQTVAVAAPVQAAGYAEPMTLSGQPPVDGQGWGAPAGVRFQHGIRLGWTYIQNMDEPTRENDMSLAQEFGLKSPNMMLLGYEAFYRVVGSSWLNVLMVGNVTVAGLEQSKFIPAASGLIGFEFNRSFQLGVGVNLTPDPQSISHMIAAAGWTPQVGKISVPLHFFYVPDTEGNNRMGATVGMTW